MKIKIEFLKSLVDDLYNNQDFISCFEKTSKKFKLSLSKKKKMLDEIFPKEIISLNKEINHIMNYELQKIKKPRNFTNYRLNEKIKFYVLKRLEISDKIFGLRKLIKINLKNRSPKNMFEIFFKISDEIWFLAGDKSTDYNFYSKRLILMNIYINSLIYFSRKEDQNQDKLKKFVDKQIENVLLFGKIKNQVNSFFTRK